jgi:hypothetical protein
VVAGGVATIALGGCPRQGRRVPPEADHAERVVAENSRDTRCTKRPVAGRGVSCGGEASTWRARCDTPRDARVQAARSQAAAPRQRRLWHAQRARFLSRAIRLGGCYRMQNVRPCALRVARERSVLAAGANATRRNGRPICPGRAPSSDARARGRSGLGNPRAVAISAMAPAGCRRRRTLSRLRFLRIARTTQVALAKGRHPICSGGHCGCVPFCLGD